MRVLREQRATPFLQEDAALARAVPHLQDVVVHLRVEDDEVEAGGVKSASKLIFMPHSPRFIGTKHDAGLRSNFADLIFII